MKRLLLLIQMLFLMTIVSYSKIITIDNIVYKIASEFPHYVEVQKSPNATGKIIIQRTIRDGNMSYTVIEIAPFAFENNNITSVTIGDFVRIIGDGAFQSNKLTSVKIPNDVYHIGDNAFANNKLTTITIPKSVHYLSGFGQNQLTSINIPNGVATIGSYAFQFNKLTSVKIPNSVTKIKQSAFYYNKLAHVTIPSNVNTIENGAFQFNQLTSVTILNNTTKINKEAFADNKLRVNSIKKVNKNDKHESSYKKDEINYDDIDFENIINSDNDFFITTIRESFSNSMSTIDKIKSSDYLYCITVNGNNISFGRSKENLHSYVIRGQKSKVWAGRYSTTYMFIDEGNYHRSIIHVPSRKAFYFIEERGLQELITKYSY